MKKVFTLFFVLFFCAGMYVNAQMIATFEDDAEDLINWGGFPGWLEGARFVEGGLPQVAANPDKSGLNKSDMCLMAINIADADWWGNFVTLPFTDPITITESNRYLRYLAYRSIQPKNFRVAFNGEQDDNQLFQGKVPKEGEWVGMVADVMSSQWATAQGENELIAEYLKIIYSNNWDNPRTGWGVATYMFDDFELSDNPMPPGVSLMDATDFSIGFEDAAEMDKWLNAIDMQHAENSYEIIENPFGKSIAGSSTNFRLDNDGGMIFKFDKSADANWWQGGPRFDFAGVMKVGEGNPEFIHVAVYIPGEVFEDRDDYSINIQLCAKDHMGNEITELFLVWDDEVDEWMDLVMDVTKLAFLKELVVRFDVKRNADDSEWVNTPANTFYLDAIAFDNDESERTEIISGLPNILPAGSQFAEINLLPGGVQVYSHHKTSVQVYNLLGGLVKSTPATFGTTNISLENGLYIVKVTSATGEKQITKVLVR